MTTELDSLHEKQSTLCAAAHKAGIELPGDLTADFDNVETGRTICSSLEKLVRSREPLADDSGGVVSADAPGETKAKPSRAAKAPATSQESTVTQNTKTAKKAKTAAKKKKVVKKAAAAKKGGAKKTRGGDTKTQKVLALLKRAGGCTRKDILKVTGWKAVSVQQIAENLGVKLKVSEERPFVYKAA